MDSNSNEHAPEGKLEPMPNKKRKLIVLTLLTAAACATRLSYISYLPGVTWDEAHFGKFASYYINRTFYHDVHPPLGKMLIAGCSWLTGYRGNFKFNVSQYYDDTIRYDLIRAQMGFFGAMLVPVSYLTVFELTSSIEASAIAALGILCDTFLHRLTTLIVLDGPLLLSICLSVYTSIKFFKQREYSFKWWKWLFLTGVSLGCVISIKYVGVFTVLFVGIQTAYQIFLLLCDVKTPILRVFVHVLLRTIFLICIPLVIYASSFILHFIVLNKANPFEGGWMHTRFFASFSNTEFGNKTFPAYINYGANLTVQSSSPMGGYLDSWFDLYPSDLTAPCQVVSTMPAKDEEGTVWMMKKVNLEMGSVEDWTNPHAPPVIVRNGDTVMLTHIATGRSLRSHGRRAPFTRMLYQVCGYGEKGQGGPFETWKIVIPGAAEGEPLKIFEHDFTLMNTQIGCYLKPTDVKLPAAWASEDGKEVACTKNPSHSDLLWHIHWIDSIKLEGETTAQNHSMNIWQLIWHQHMIMFKMNYGLKEKTKPGETGPTHSFPWLWPFAYQMQTMAAYADSSVPSEPSSVSHEEQTLFSVGSLNPFVAYLNVASFIISIGICLYHYFRLLRQREDKPHQIERREKTLKALFWLVLCWACHFVPFFFMSRILYLHHYLPSHIFACMISGVSFNFLSECLNELTMEKWKFESRGYVFALPSVVFLFSYAWLFPLATYVEGEVFKPVPRINSLLDYLHYGQRWIEFGYRFEEFSGKMILRSEIIDFEEESLENPYLNISLFYLTDLENTVTNNTNQISPSRPISLSDGIRQGDKHVLIQNNSKIDILESTDSQQRRI